MYLQSFSGDDAFSLAYLTHIVRVLSDLLAFALPSIRVAQLVYVGLLVVSCWSLRTGGIDVVHPAAVSTGFKHSSHLHVYHYHSVFIEGVSELRWRE